MEVEGTHHASQAPGGSIPRPTPPAGPPPMPPAPPPGHRGAYHPHGPHSPHGPHGTREHRVSDLLAWLRTERPAHAPGIYGFGHRPRPPYDPNRISDRQLLGSAVLSLLTGLFVWSLFWNDIIPVLGLVSWLTPHSWHSAGSWTVLSYLVYGLVIALLIKIFGRTGHWIEVYRRFVRPALLRVTEPASPPEQQAHEHAEPPSAWPELRRAGHPELAERLDVDIRAGRMNDVDYARLRRAWESVERLPSRLGSFAEAVLRHGAAACSHPSGLRDLPRRTADHDLLTGQVRIGTAPDSDKNPHAHRGASIALDPGLLGTSLLVVGPPGSGKTTAVARPVVEALCLQALAGTAAVVAVGAADVDLGPQEAFDVVISLGDPSSPYDLDLYGGSADPDEAATFLAAALLPEGETDTRRARMALSQLLGPFHVAHGRHPAVSELRELLDGTPTAFASLRAALDEAGAVAYHRELEARERQVGRPEDVGPLLADRVALLCRPAFAGFFDVSGQGRPFSLRAMEHPLRVRIALPERGHAEASRILARLVLAQFTTAVAQRADRSLFACLVLDDAAHTVTADIVRDIQRLRSVNAGVVLALRTLDDVPESLRTALLGSVGCQMALAGVTTWDGTRFAESWGTTWVDEQAVTHTPDRSGGLLRRTLRALRKLLTGVAVTTESVTTRKVERPLWSASELAHAVPAGHAVVSLTTTSGEHVPPVLVNLRT